MRVGFVCAFRLKEAMATLWGRLHKHWRENQQHKIIYFALLLELYTYLQ